MSYCGTLLDVAKRFCKSDGVPRPSVTAEHPDLWRVVADYVVSTRESLEMSQADLVAYSGVSQSVVSKIENARPDNGRFARESLKRVALALLLHPDALVQLAGGLPLEQVRETAHNYWNFCEDNGGWEMWHKIPPKKMSRSRRQRRTQLRTLELFSAEDPAAMPTTNDLVTPEYEKAKKRPRKRPGEAARDVG